jgi:hypothetical protein
MDSVHGICLTIMDDDKRSNASSAAKRCRRVTIEQRQK